MIKWRPSDTSQWNARFMDHQNSSIKAHWFTFNCMFCLVYSVKHVMHKKRFYFSTCQIDFITFTICVIWNGRPFHSNLYLLSSWNGNNKMPPKLQFLRETEKNLYWCMHLHYYEFWLLVATDGRNFMHLYLNVR